MNTIWEIGDSDTCIYHDRDSLLAEVQWDLIGLIDEQACDQLNSWN